MFQKPESFLRSEGYLQGTVQGTEPLPYDVDYYIDDLVAYSSTDPTKDNILAFFDDSVEAGTIVGRGNRFANFRLWLMQTMLQAAAEFIEQDLIGLSCFMLNGAHRRSDGEPRPRDFIEGEAVPAMMVMIEDLMESLGCDNF